MAIAKFVDEAGSNLNRYKMTDANGNTSVVFLTRYADITQVGTMLNAEKINEIIDTVNDIEVKESVTVADKSFIPNASGTYDIGSDNKNWNYVYTNYLVLKNKTIMPYFWSYDDDSGTNNVYFYAESENDGNKAYIVYTQDNDSTKVILPLSEANNIENGYDYIVLKSQIKNYFKYQHNVCIMGNYNGTTSLTIWFSYFSSSPLGITNPTSLYNDLYTNYPNQNIPVVGRIIFYSSGTYTRHDAYCIIMKSATTLRVVRESNENTETYDFGTSWNSITITHSVTKITTL